VLSPLVESSHDDANHTAVTALTAPATARLARARITDAP
jgi:hypothetical protein